MLSTMWPVTLYNRRKPEIRSRIFEEIKTYAVTLVDFKEFIKWPADDSSEDPTMMAVLTAATKQAEGYTRRALLNSTWRTTLECFGACVKLDVHPIDLTTIVVKYYDENDALQTLSAS